MHSFSLEQSVIVAHPVLGGSLHEKKRSQIFHARIRAIYVSTHGTNALFVLNFRGMR